MTATKTSAASREPLLPVEDIADALTDPHRHAERIEYWDSNRHRKFRTHITTQPGLLAQLAELMLPGGDPDAGAGVAESRPPGRWDAVATHTTITVDVARWVWDLGLEQRATVESNIRQLLGHLSRADADDRRQLEKSIRRWHRSAEIVAGWKSPPLDPRAPCPALVDDRECGERTLRIQLSESTAFCGTCGTEWDSDNIGLLAEAVRAYKAATEAAAVVARLKVRRDKMAERGAA